MTNSSRATVSMPGWPGCNSTQRPPEAGSWTVDSFSRGNDLSQPSDIEPAVGTLFRREVRNRFHQFRSEEHTSELQSLMRISYAVFCLKKKILHNINNSHISLSI